MSSPQLNDEERKHLRFARIAIYVFPIVAGLLTVSLMIVAPRFFSGRNAGYVWSAAWAANSFLAGIASAIVVAREHPQERGKWWRAGTSFLFAFPMTLMTTIFFAICAGCAGIIK